MIHPSPFADRMLLHLSTQPRQHDPLLAAIAGGVVLQAPMRRDIARTLIKSSSVAVLQHDGRNPEEQGTLWTPDEVWMLEQADASVMVSRTAMLGHPAQTSYETVVAAIDDFRQFTHRSAAFGYVSAAASIAIDRRWLTTTERRRTLISALTDVGGPIHLMLASEADPLESTHAVAGLVDVVSTVPDVAVVRCDHGALGAYAFGALGGSIGVTGGTRHFLMPGKRGMGVFDDPTPRVFVPSLKVWWRGSKLALSRDPLFDCECVQCGGSNLSRFEDESLLREADTHSVTAWTSMMDQLRQAEPGSARQKHWIDSCETAWAAVGELEDRSGLPQPVSKQLKAWLRFAGVRVY